MEAMKDYVKHFPKGKHLFEAKGCVAWAGIKACGDKESVERFSGGLFQDTVTRRRPGIALRSWSRMKHRRKSRGCFSPARRIFRPVA